MWYAILGNDKADSLTLRLEARPEHLKRINTLRAQGRLLLAGPFPAADCENPGDQGYTGSLIVADFDSLKDAESWIAADPYVLSGVFASYLVKPFRKVAP